MKRLFAFGSSFTRYQWPMWPEVLGNSFDHAENWGRGGAGNPYIHNAVVECHLRNNITQDDVVGVMWTNVSREDRYLNGEWKTEGNVFFNKLHDANWVKKWADIRGYYIRDLALIYSTKQLLDSIGCRYFFTSCIDIRSINEYDLEVAQEIEDLLDQYKPLLDSFKPSIHKTVFNGDWASRPLLSNYQQALKNYQDVAGPDWPAFESIIDGSYVSQTPKNIIQEMFSSKWSGWTKPFKHGQRPDNHPTPLEAVIFLEDIAPEFVIDNTVKIAATQIDYLIRQQKPLEDCWSAFRTRRDIKRW